MSDRMPRRRGLDSKPCEYLAPGEAWPYGGLIEDAPAAARFVKELAMNVKDCCKKRTVYDIANKAGVNAQTIFNFLNGHTWGDVVVIFRIEHEVGEKLWPHDHLSPGWGPEATPGREP